MEKKRQSRIALDMLGVEVTVDLDDPEMPEDVREYYREYIDQAEAELPTDVYRLSTRSLPEYVVRYCAGILKKIERRYNSLDDTVRAGDLDPAYLTEYIALKAGLIGQDYGRKLEPKQRDMLYDTCREIAREFRYLLLADSDWQALGARQAIKLYIGVIISRLGLTKGKIAREDDNDAAEG